MVENLSYEVVPILVTSPSAFGPLSSIVVSDSVCPDPILGALRSSHVLSTISVVVSGVRSAVRVPGSILGETELSGSFVGATSSAWAAVSPAGASGPVAIPNILTNVVPVVLATGVAVNAGWSVVADVGRNLPSRVVVVMMSTGSSVGRPS